MDFKIGLHPGISRADYDSVIALNQSSIKLIDERHVKAAWRRLHHPDPPSEAMIQGSAFHCLLLEPKMFAERFVARPHWDMRKKADKLEREVWESENPGWQLRDEIEIEKLGELQLQVAMLKAHPIVGEWIKHAKAYECAVFWEDDVHGFPCKALIDAISVVNGRTIVWDPKTTRDATPAFWRKEINNRNYMVQAEWTIQGLNAVAPADRDFFFVALETKGEMDIGLYEVGALSRFEARHRIRKACKKWQRAQETGIYPGAPTAPQMIDAPKYAMTHERDYEEEEEIDDAE